MIDCDVAIIGYGPTGMTLAAFLGALGHKVLVLERYANLYNLPRAACFDDEIMRTFQKLGIVDQLAGGVVAQADYDWVNAAGETLVRLEYDPVAPGGWPALYMMYQPFVEAVLDRHDRGLASVTVRQGFTVTEHEQDDDGVTLTGVDADGRSSHVRARFVVGADGGNGFSRRTFCEEFDDYGFQENWLVCDFRLKGPVEGLPMFRQICDPAQPISIVRIGPHHHRFSFMLEHDESPERATEASRVWSRVAGYLTPHDAELVRAANYVFRSRITAQWRYGRVLLAGDAAHEMPPFLGQGMCSGIRDAHNLAWKLDFVLTDRADAGLLDTYQPEREPHVRFITEKAIELGRVQTMRDPLEARQRDDRLLALRRDNRAPDKVLLPALSGGFIADDGSFFPQGRVRRADKSALLDDIVGYGWRLFISDAVLLSAVTGDRRARWEAIGGATSAIADNETDGALEDQEGVYATWFRSHACSAALVRPDWYVYGTAGDAPELGALMDRLAAALRNGVN